jgi:hypothetical protein
MTKGPALVMALILTAPSIASAKITSFVADDALLHVLQSKQLQAFREKESPRLSNAELETASVAREGATAPVKFTITLSWRVTSGPSKGATCSVKASTSSEVTNKNGIVSSHLIDPAFSELHCADSAPTLR